MPASDHIRSKVSQLPHKPGVYLMKDRFGTVIYVGKARDLKRRVSSYFQQSRRQGWDLKFNALVDAIHDLDVHIVRSDAESVLLEGRLIKEFRPRYNISFRDDKHFLLLKVNLNDPIPRFTLTRFKQEDGATYFGPFAGSGSLRRTLALVRHKFNLRGCRPLNPGAADYKHCLYANLRHCTAPCVGNVTTEQYLMQVRAACDFLSGHCREMETQIETEMKQAAATLDFERAALLRDLLTDIRRTTEKTRKFDRLPQRLPVAIDPDRDLVELAAALGLPASPRRIEGFDISNISGTFAVASMVCFRDGRPDRTQYRRFRMRSVVGQDDFACMAETIQRHYSRVRTELAAAREPDPAGPPPAPRTRSRRPAELPDLILIDGGKGQLNAACAELLKLGLQHIPILGIAKEFEELHRPGIREPLRLGLDSNALKLLQRVRDESHRFANTYNAQLRLRKISESVLDEFPGIGEQRKSALLKRFGSVQRLRLATAEQIAEVQGFGGQAAAELKRFLDARAATPPPPPA